MLAKTRSFFRTIFLFGNLGVIVAYLAVCLVPFIDTGKFWYFALPGLAFPLILFALVCFIVVWAVLKSRWVWLSVIVLLAGTQQIAAVFSFHFPSDFSEEKTANTLRILHWNVQSWEEKQEMLGFIKEQNADILCFEEYSDRKNINSPRSVTSAIKELGYPYYFFGETKDPFDKNGSKGVIIFSKYPIIQSDIFSYGKNTNAEHLIYADIKVGENTFRIFTTHLQSVRFEESDYESLQRLKHAKDPGYHDSRTIVSKLKKGYEYRYIQSQIVKQKITESPYPVIITGDFNDVPNSNTYFTIKGKLQDAFLKKGSGIGRTFRFISPTLRIDYILADKKFKVSQFRIPHVSFSDHYPLKADLQY